MQRANPAAFRQAASRFATGVAVLTALDEHGRVCGMTANSFVTVSLSPPTVLVSVMPDGCIRRSRRRGRYCVNVLPELVADLSRHFAGRPSDRRQPDYDIVEGLPQPVGCMAFFACEVTRHVDVSDHTLFIAEVRAATIATPRHWCSSPAGIISGRGCRWIGEGDVARGRYSSAFGNSIWMPLLPSTSWVTRRLPASEHSM